MSLKKNIPDTILSFAGTGIDIGDTIRYEEIVSRNTILKQEGTGNKCGHNPFTFREFERPAHHKQRPIVIEKAINNLAKAYFNPYKFLPKINFQNRKKRSERREAISAVMQLLSHFVDLITLEVGIFNEVGELKRRLDLKWIAKRAGLSFSRAKRALKDLNEAGYITTTKSFKKPSIRTICREFFYALGIKKQKLFTNQEWKRKKQEKQFKKNENRVGAALVKALSIPSHGFNNTFMRSKSELAEAKVLSEKIGCSPIEALKIIRNTS